MSILKKAYKLSDRGIVFPKALYQILSEYDFSRGILKNDAVGDGMWVISQCIWGWWKPRFICDDGIQNAYLLTTEDMRWAIFTHNDINWDSLKGLPEKAIERAEDLDMVFPSFICGFEDGIGMVSWQLNPDGRYYQDDDGFGMTNDKEIEVYAYIDKNLNVLVPFRYMEDDLDKLIEMNEEAIRIFASQNKKELWKEVKSLAIESEKPKTED